MLVKLLYTLGCSIFLVALVSCTKKIENKPLPLSVEEQYLSSNHEIGKMLDALIIMMYQMMRSERYCVRHIQKSTKTTICQLYSSSHLIHIQRRYS